jgi:hypothetical protein
MYFSPKDKALQPNFGCLETYFLHNSVIIHIYLEDFSLKFLQEILCDRRYSMTESNEEAKESAIELGSWLDVIVNTT